MIDTSQFIVDTLTRDVRNIYNAQRLILEKGKALKGAELKVVKVGSGIGRGKSSVGTGRLADALEHPDFAVQAFNGRFIVTNNILLYMRFMDIKQLHGQIYNRQVWGILYNHALPDIRLGLFTNVYDSVGAALRKAFEED